MITKSIFTISDSLTSKSNKNIISTIDDVRGYGLGPPDGTPPASVIANKNKTEILQGHINEKEDGSYLSLRYLIKW